MTTVADKRTRTAEGVAALAEQGRDALEDLKGELAEVRDRMEEHFSQTERYTRVAEAAEKIEEIYDSLDGVQSDLRELDFSW